MAPVLASREEMIAGTPDTAISTNSQYTPWLVVLVVIGALAIISMISYLTAERLRSKHFDQAAKNDPYLTKKECRRRRKLSALERMEEEELQRSIMIRKSLATRSSRTNSQASQYSHHDDFEMAQESATTSLRHDWKEWEARMQRERSNSGERHPFSEASASLDLPIPPQSRTASPSRSPLLKAGTTPPLPNISTFAQVSDMRSFSRPRPAEFEPAHLH
jgi:FtsZ-interacting cell division protein ZipA